MVSLVHVRDLPSPSWGPTQRPVVRGAHARRDAWPCSDTGSEVTKMGWPLRHKARPHDAAIRARCSGVRTRTHRPSPRATRWMPWRRLRQIDHHVSGHAPAKVTISSAAPVVEGSACRSVGRRVQSVSRAPIERDTRWTPSTAAGAVDVRRWPDELSFRRTAGPVPDTGSRGQARAISGATYHVTAVKKHVPVPDPPSRRARASSGCRAAQRLYEGNDSTEG